MTICGCMVEYNFRNSNGARFVIFRIASFQPMFIEELKISRVHPNRGYAKSSCLLSSAYSEMILKASSAYRHSLPVRGLKIFSVILMAFIIIPNYADNNSNY